jgi:NAD(P)-dependent dehydrogenase (short-subunit alcohol dehydrogenase family)
MMYFNEPRKKRVYVDGSFLQLFDTNQRDLVQRFNNMIPLQGDITNRESLSAMVQTVKARHGYIDLLVNNAGIARNLYLHPLPSPEESFQVHSPPSPPASPSCELPQPSIKAFQSALWNTGTPEDFAETFSTNVTAPYYTTVAFLDLLHKGNIRQQEGTFSSFMLPPFHTSQVLTISSSGSFRVDPKIVSMSYTLSKAASTHLGKCLANLLAPWGIRSNVLAPGVWPSGTSFHLLLACISRRSTKSNFFQK